MRHNKKLFFVLPTLLFMPMMGSAQTDVKDSENQVVGVFTVQGENGKQSNPGTIVKYKKQELYVQKGDVYYDIDMTLEWPVIEGGTEKDISHNVFNVDADDMESAITAYVNKMGTKVDNITIHNGIKIHYITIKLSVAEYIKGKYVTTYLYYSDQPAPYMDDQPVMKKTYHTYKWQNQPGKEVALNNLFTKKGSKKGEIIQEIKKQMSEQIPGMTIKQIPQQIAISGSHVIFHSDVEQTDGSKNVFAKVDMANYKDCLTEEGQFLLGFIEFMRPIVTKDAEVMAEKDMEVIKIKENEQNTEEQKKVFDVVESMPSFPGGISALMSYLSRNIKYPEDAVKAGIMGRVLVQFVVEKDGSIGDVCVNQMVSPSLDREAARVVMSMPKWVPGRQNGDFVRVKYTLPITFKF